MTSKCSSDDQSGCPLNFEVDPSLAIKVMVNDNGVPPARATFDLTIKVTDENDAPYNLDLSGNFTLLTNVLFCFLVCDEYQF